MDAYQNAYLVPITAILLCTLACVGISYGLISAHSSEGSSITTDAGVLDIKEGGETLTQVQFHVEYETTYTDGKLTASIDKEHSDIEKKITLSLKSHSGAAKTVHIVTPDGIETDCGLTYYVGVFAADKDGKAIGTPLTEIRVIPNTTVNLVIKLTVMGMDDVSPEIADPEHHTTPVFSLNFTTKNVNEE